MKMHRVSPMVLGAIVVSACLVGCGEPNSNVKTDLAQLSLPKGVSDKPVEKPFKSRAKRSSPPLNQQPGK